MFNIKKPDTTLIDNYNKAQPLLEKCYQVIDILREELNKEVGTDAFRSQKGMLYESNSSSSYCFVRVFYDSDCDKVKLSFSSHAYSVFVFDNSNVIYNEDQLIKLLQEWLDLDKTQKEIEQILYNLHKSRQQ